MGRKSKRRNALRVVTCIVCLISSSQKLVMAIDESMLSDLRDDVEDSMFDPIQADPSCSEPGADDCYRPPDSTIEVETRLDATCFKGGDDPWAIQGEDSESAQDMADTNDQCSQKEEVIVDKHWGSDPIIRQMRDQLRTQAQEALQDKRPPIFLLPGLASTRLVAWKLKKCAKMFQGDIKVQDNVWLNINLVLQMGAVNVQCMQECLSLGQNQSDAADWEIGCKLRPDEGLDAIASLAPGGIGSSLLVGGTNTVYAWLIQWLADNLGYDVTNIVGLPYDWRLSPDKMEARDGFLSMTRRRIEAAVASNGHPGILVAHSMGNLIFRYFLDWLRLEMRDETYQEYVARARRRAQSLKKAEQQRQPILKPNSFSQNPPQGEEPMSSFLPGWMTGVVSGLDDWYEWLTSEEGGDTEKSKEAQDSSEALNAQLWELSKEEGDAKWLEWVEKHIWTYIGLSAPMLGATNPLRSVISGENMGLPITDDVARIIEITFGSTHTVNPVSTSTGFCDEWNEDSWGEESDTSQRKRNQENDDVALACLDDIMNDIEFSSVSRDPWKNYPALKSLLHDRMDWDTGKPMIDIKVETCDENAKKKCTETQHIKLGPRDAESGNIFNAFNDLWNEEGEPLIVKREQLEESFINNRVPNILNNTWERPLIKHVIMAYGVDVPTEVGYIYKKTMSSTGDANADGDAQKTDGVPNLKAAFWEEAGGNITVESVDTSRGSLAEHFIKKKSKKVPYDPQAKKMGHSGDGSVPYISLAWVHTWLLHAVRARRYQDEDNEGPRSDRKTALDHISISHRPRGAIEWVEGPPPEEAGVAGPSKLVDTADTGVDHPHGTRYKPLMTRYHNTGVSRKTGIEYTTTVIEAVGVEHKETTRNYDILAAVFTDALKYMHEDLGLV